MEEWPSFTWKECKCWNVWLYTPLEKIIANRQFQRDAVSYAEMGALALALQSGTVSESVSDNL